MPQRRGFACLSPEERRRIATLGGKKIHEMGVAHKFTTAEAVAAGQKGGRSLRAKTRRDDPTYYQRLGAAGIAAQRARSRTMDGKLVTDQLPVPAHNDTIDTPVGE